METPKSSMFKILPELILGNIISEWSIYMFQPHSESLYIFFLLSAIY